MSARLRERVSFSCGRHITSQLGIVGSKSCALDGLSQLNCIILLDAQILRRGDQRPQREKIDAIFIPAR